MLAISRFRVANGLERAVRQAFEDRPHLVEQAPGFEGMSVFRGLGDPATFLLITQWTDLESYRAWHSSDAHTLSHVGIPPGLKLDAVQTELTFWSEIRRARNGSPDETGTLDWTAFLGEFLWSSGVIHFLTARIDGAIQACNAQMSELLGISEQNLRKQPVWTYLIEADASRLRERIESYGRGLGSPETQELGEGILLNFVSAADHVPHTLECKVYIQDKGFAVIGAVPYKEELVLQRELREINNEVLVQMRENARENKDLKAESQRLELELRQSQKMEAIGRLAGGIAHDFNNLLTVICGYSQMLQANAAVAGAMREPIAQIVEAADRAAALTAQLLTFSRRRATEARDVDPNLVVGSLERLLRRLLGEDLEVTVSLAPGCGQIRADPNQIEQAIINLAVNARDAMPGGGRLVIETASLVVDEVFASRHIDLTPGEYAQITVRDTGCGMAAEVQARLFEPFFTTKEPGKGTGLGLSIVYSIVKQMGGKILVDSEVGKGTTFRLFFPKLRAAGEVHDVPPPVQPPCSGTETILIVDDEKVIREYVRAVLGEQGYTLLEAANGVLAMEVAHNYRGEISLLLTDVVMPQMGGLQLAGRLRELRPGLKVLYISGYSEPRMEGSLSSGDRIIQKPFSPTAIAGIVREILDA
jgi:signal transduction histidine kinase/heme-degrading monooxygenase HmoA